MANATPSNSGDNTEARDEFIESQAPKLTKVEKVVVDTWQNNTSSENYDEVNEAMDDINKRLKG
ncbi:MAG: hypothetical protein WBA57_08720 [Elainellaceae cyanobacterium]